METGPTRAITVSAAGGSGPSPTHTAAQTAQAEPVLEASWVQTHSTGVNVVFQLNVFLEANQNIGGNCIFHDC